MDENLVFYLLKQKNIIYDKGDLLPIYIYKKETQENFYYFDKELPSKDDNSDKEIENNKVDKENKENILDNEPLKALVSNKNIQTLSAQEEKEYS